MGVGERVVSTQVHSLKFRTDSIQCGLSPSCCVVKHILTSREHGNVLERPVQTLPETPESQLIHGGKHHFKMVRTAGHEDVKRKVHHVFCFFFPR